MKISVILAHPDRRSFNHAIAKAVVKALRDNGHRVSFHDLYMEKFDPILTAREIPRRRRLDKTIKDHCLEIAKADGIIIIHPNWWGQPPAILKGWVDRVFRPGVAYEFREGDSGEGVPVGRLKATKVVIFNTSNTRPEREREVFGDPLETLWRNCIFGLCGVRDVHRHTFSVLVTSSAKERGTWLNKVRRVVLRVFPETSASRKILRKDRYFVYIVECADGTFYTGYTHDLDKRVVLHNSGRGAKYLRGKRPVKLVYAKEYRYYLNALREERRVKTLSRAEKEELVRNYRRG